MPSEILIEGIGVMRELNDWQIARLLQTKRQDRSLAYTAFSLGMTTTQFKKLTLEQQKLCLRASHRLSEPPPYRQEV